MPKDDWDVSPPKRAVAFTPALPDERSLTTREQKEVARKLQLHRDIETAKAVETELANQMIDAMNDRTTYAGLDTIEDYTALRNEPRHPDGQRPAATYLQHRMNKKLIDRETTTDIGIRAIQRKLAEPLDPGPEPEPKKKGWFTW